MARKTLLFTLNEEGRDKGKIFVLTEMPAAQAEKWGLRAILALAGSGVSIPDEVKDMGMVGIATLGFQALGGAKWELVEPLLDEMMSCVSIQPDPARPDIVRGLIPDDIEEPKTFVRLRREVFELHTGFFALAAALRSKAEALKAAAPENSPST